MNKENSKDMNCSYNNFKRARYFHGMLMTDRDFREEQIYHDDKRKLLNKMLHGWGVVCGLEIKPTEGPSSTIVIKQGLAIDCCGNEIYVPEEYSLNIGKILKSGLNPKLPCIEPPTEINEKKLYVIIRYVERNTDQVQIYAPGGGCEEKTCENSRTQEGYCIELKDEVNPACCPTPLGTLEDKDNPYSKYEKSKGESEIDEEGIRKLLCEDFLMPCPGKCCDDNKYVVLGSVCLNMTDGSGTEFQPVDSSMINNWDCRNYVMSFGLLQHWMRLLAPREFPIEYIVNYPKLKDSCKKSGDAVKTFKADFRLEEREKTKPKKKP